MTVSSHGHVLKPALRASFKGSCAGCSTPFRPDSKQRFYCDMCNYHLCGACVQSNRSKPTWQAIPDEEVVHVDCTALSTFLLMKSGHVFIKPLNKEAVATRIAVPNEEKISALSCSADHALFLSTSGTVFGLGSNAHGQLGKPTTDCQNANELLQISPPGLGFVAVAAGGRHSLCVAQGGEVYGCGANDRVH